MERLIDETNKGRIKTQLRGSRRSNVADLLADVRKKTVELVKSSGVSVQEKFTACTLATWIKNNPAQDARRIVKKVNVPGRGYQECVLMRQAPEGTFDVIVSEYLKSLVREVVDDSDDVLRKNQQEYKQADLGKQITMSVLTDMDKAKVVDDPHREGLAGVFQF